MNSLVSRTERNRQPGITKHAIKKRRYYIFLVWGSIWIIVLIAVDVSKRERNFKIYRFCLPKQNSIVQSSKLNFGPAQVKEILNSHENKLVKFFNTATERQFQRIQRKKWRVRNLQCSFILVQLSKSFLKECSDKSN